MVVTYSLKIGNVEMTAGGGYIVESLGDTPILRSEWSSRLGGDTGLFIRDQYEGRRLTLEGVIVGDDAEGVRTRLDALLYELSLGERQVRYFTQTTPQDVRTIAARLERDPEWEWFNNGLTRAVRFQLRMRARRATWQGSDEINDSWTVTSSPANRLLTYNPGTAPAFPMIGLTNAMGSTNLSGIYVHFTLLGAAGKSLVVQGLDLTAGDVLFFDFMDGRIGDGTIQAPRPASIEGEWWSLPPLAASTIQIVTNASLTSPEGLNLACVYRPQFWSC